MLTKQIIIPMIIFSIMLQDCNKLTKCKRYVGEYSYNGQNVVIKYDGVHFIMDKQNKSITCTCTDDGTLTIKDSDSITLLTLIQDSDGHKTICLDASGTNKDCMQKKQ